MKIITFNDVPNIILKLEIVLDQVKNWKDIQEDKNGNIRKKITIQDDKGILTVILNKIQEQKFTLYITYKKLNEEEDCFVLMQNFLNKGKIK